MDKNKKFTKELIENLPLELPLPNHLTVFLERLVISWSRYMEIHDRVKEIYLDKTEDFYTTKATEYLSPQEKFYLRPLLNLKKEYEVVLNSSLILFHLGDSILGKCEGTLIKLLEDNIRNDEVTDKDMDTMVTALLLANELSVNNKTTGVSERAGRNTRRKFAEYGGYREYIRNTIGFALYDESLSTVSRREAEVDPANDLIVGSFLTITEKQKVHIEDLNLSIKGYPSTGNFKEPVTFKESDISAEEWNAVLESFGIRKGEYSE